MMEYINGVNASMAEGEYGGRTLEVEPFDLRYPFEETNLLRVNIEGQKFRGTVDAVMRDYIKDELERIAINSRTSGVEHTSWAGYNTGNMTTIDGWYAQALSGAHIFNADPLGTTPYYVKPSLFKSLWKLLPTKWRARKSEFVFFVASDVGVEYESYFTSRETPLGDTALIDGKVATWSGIPIIPVPMIPTDARFVANIRPDTSDTEVSETGSGYGNDQEYSWLINGEAGEGYEPTDETENYTWVLLARPSNLALGYGPEIKVNRQMHDSGKFTYYNFWGQFGANFFIIDQVALAINVTPTVDPDLGV